MRIAVFHNFYRTDRPSGENSAVLADVEMLRAAGHEVLLARRESDEVTESGPSAKVRAAASAVYSLPSKGATNDLVRTFRPQVAHVHNLLPLWSPSVLDALHGAGVPSLQVLQNYRLSCLNGSHVLAGAACFKCSGRTVAAPGVQHRCYNGSLAGSAVVATSRMVNQPRQLQRGRYLAVSEIVRSRAVQHGVDPGLITVKPEHRVGRVAVADSPGHGLVSIGRLDRNKGILLLLDAYAAYRDRGGVLPLSIAGSGADEEQVAAAAAIIDGLTYLGQVEPEQVPELIASSRAVVSLALWEEPFGLTVLEAWAEARPIIVTAIGGPAAMVSDANGWVVEPDRDAVVRAFSEAEDQATAATRGADGAAALAERFSPDATLQAYEDAWNLLGVARDS